MQVLEDQRRELVELFSSHGAVVDPDLLSELAEAEDGAVRAQDVLAGLQEIPFHFDRALWLSLEAKRTEALSAPEPPAPAPDAERARKEAFRKAAAAIYDGQNKRKDVDAEDDDSDEDESLHVADKLATDVASVRAKEFTVTGRSDWQPIAKQYESGLEVIDDMTGKSTCEGTTADFVSYFQDRYDRIAKMLRQRRDLRNNIPVERIRPGQAEVQLIGMVVEANTTKNGHKLIEIEDTTGSIKCLVNANEKQLIAFADTLVNDEVIGVIGQASNKGDMVFLESIVRPDLPRPDHTLPKGSDAPLMAAFLSDIHVGSDTFLSEQWESMLKWLNGEGASKREREAAGKVKYVVIPGDLVDGVGIYPGQQDELTIPDIYDQYAAFGDWMKNIPDWVDIIVQPGNHDASRPAEPQPAFAQDVREKFDHHDARFLANPAWFSMHGVKTLGYHGSSLIDFATSVAHLEYEQPLPAMKQMLQSRHLAPLYGERTPVAPEHHDYLVIEDIPDLFVTGHVHVPGIESYRGVQMINSGTWQSQTLYQKMLNFTPEPAKMPLIDLQTLRGTLVDFQAPAVAGDMS